MRQVRLDLPAERRPPGFDARMVSALPKLRPYARSLTGNAVDAEDLVQDVAARALGRSDMFDEATNLVAWMMTMMLNIHRSGRRKAWREVPDIEGLIAGAQPISGGQIEALMLIDARRTLDRMPDVNRSTFVRLLMGDAMAEVAAADRVALGTVKSRASRARAAILAGA